jgi:hypothetical protein
MPRIAGTSPGLEVGDRQDDDPACNLVRIRKSNWEQLLRNMENRRIRQDPIVGKPSAVFAIRMAQLLCLASLMEFRKDVNG